MARSGVIGTYNPPPGTNNQIAGTPISPAMFNGWVDDVTQTFNTIQPEAYGGTGAATFEQARTNLGVPASTDIRGRLYGLTLSNNTSDAANDIDISTGIGVNGDGVVFALNSVLTKRIDASWSAGTNQGGLDTGVVGTGWYYIHLIRRPDTGVVDALFSLSSIAPTLPTGYTQFRRIGAIVRQVSGIRLFAQVGNVFTFSTPFGDVAAAAPGTSAVPRVLSIPPGIPCTAIVSTAVVDSSSDGNTTWLYISPVASADVAPGPSAFTSLSLASVGQLAAGGSVVRVYSASGGVIRTRVSRSSNITLYVTTLGWEDSRDQ